MEELYDVETFLERMRNGEITDFCPYLTAKSTDIQVLMAENGILVDELAKQENPEVLKALIEHKYCQEHYEDWAQNAPKDIRVMLAKYGYCPDILIHDSEYDIRCYVFAIHPDYAKFCLDTTNPSEFYELVDLFTSAAHPNFEHIYQLRQNPLYAQFGVEMEDNIEYYSGRFYRQYRCNLEAKVAAFEYPLSPIERTMSLYQLFVSGNKRWPAMVSGSQRLAILTYENELRTHKRGQEWFNRILDKRYGYYDIYREIDATYGLPERDVYNDLD